MQYRPLGNLEGRSGSAGLVSLVNEAVCAVQARPCRSGPKGHCDPTAETVPSADLSLLHSGGDCLSLCPEHLGGKA